MFWLLPVKFVALARQLRESCSDLIEDLRRKASIRVDSKAFDVVVWSEVLDIPPSFAIEVFGLPKVSNGAISKAKAVVSRLEKELVEVKCKCWVKWGEIVAANVTTLREIIRPIFAYARTCKHSQLKRGKREKYGQAQIEMINAFFEIRRIGAHEGLKVLGETVAGIPIYLLFWLPRIPSKRTFFQTIR